MKLLFHFIVNVTKSIPFDFNWRYMSIYIIDCFETFLKIFKISDSSFVFFLIPETERLFCKNTSVISRFFLVTTNRITLM